MTQAEMALKYIDDFGSITVRQAMVDLGIGSPTKCISNIRKNLGVKLETRTVYHLNRYGKKTHHAEWRRAEP